jgi:hypothetical protein
MTLLDPPLAVGKNYGLLEKKNIAVMSYDTNANTNHLLVDHSIPIDFEHS